MAVKPTGRDKGTYSEGHRSYYERHKETILPKLKISSKLYRDNLKIEALEHYGSACYCCKESNKTFLTLDHIENDGAQHRTAIFGKNIGGGYRFYLWLKRNNWPKGLQIACFNCNQGRSNNGGVCPHGRHN